MNIEKKYFNLNDHKTSNTNKDFSIFFTSQVCQSNTNWEKDLAKTYAIAYCMLELENKINK